MTYVFIQNDMTGLFGRTVHATVCSGTSRAARWPPREATASVATRPARGDGVSRDERATPSPAATR